MQVWKCESWGCVASQEDTFLNKVVSKITVSGCTDQTNRDPPCGEVWWFRSIRTAVDLDITHPRGRICCSEHHQIKKKWWHSQKRLESLKSSVSPPFLVGFLTAFNLQSKHQSLPPWSVTLAVGVVRCYGDPPGARHRASELSWGQFLMEGDRSMGGATGNGFWKLPCREMIYLGYIHV